jgi:hypothetical protein
MNLEGIRKVLDAEWFGGETSRTDSSDREVLLCHASDLMSDVLTFTGAGSLLLTGLTNAQVIRAAEISDFAGVCFVRGKKPQPEAVQLAQERGIAMLVTPLSMFESCGRLHAKGLPGGDRAREDAKCRSKK